MSAERTGSRLRFEFIRAPDRRVFIETDILRATDDLIVVAHALSPSTPLTFRGEVVMERGYRAVWFLFKNQAYDVARVYRPDGPWTGYYVDVLEPVRWTGAEPATLEPVIDLFLDLWIAPDGGYAVLDEDEFEEAIARGVLTPRQVNHARQVLGDLVEATAQGGFPPQVVKDFRPPPGVITTG